MYTKLTWKKACLIFISSLTLWASACGAPPRLGSDVALDLEDDQENLPSDLIAVRDTRQNLTVLSSQGKLVFTATQVGSVYQVSRELIAYTQAWDEKQLIVVNRAGTTILPITPYKEFILSGSLVAFKDSRDEWTIVNSQGHAVLSPVKLSGRPKLAENYAAYKTIGGELVLIDQNGKSLLSKKVFPAGQQFLISKEMYGYRENGSIWTFFSFEDHALVSSKFSSASHLTAEAVIYLKAPSPAAPHAEVILHSRKSSRSKAIKFNPYDLRKYSFSSNYFVGYLDSGGVKRLLIWDPLEKFDPFVADEKDFEKDRLIQIPLQSPPAFSENVSFSDTMMAFVSPKGTLEAWNIRYGRLVEAGKVVLLADYAGRKSFGVSNELLWYFDKDKKLSILNSKKQWILSAATGFEDAPQISHQYQAFIDTPTK